MVPFPLVESPSLILCSFAPGKCLISVSGREKRQKNKRDGETCVVEDESRQLPW